MNILTESGIKEVEQITPFRLLKESIKNGELQKEITEESSWYLMDQQGHFYTSGPFKQILPYKYKDGETPIPLFNIRGHWMSISDIESTFKDFEELTGTTFPQMKD